MKQRTEEEIKEFLQRETNFYDTNYEPELRVCEDYVEITVEDMYEAPTLNYSILHKIAKFFDTMYVSDEENFGGGGCETCDYGSRYGFTLTIRPGDPFEE